MKVGKILKMRTVQILRMDFFVRGALREKGGEKL
jgi:hypothetical protein